MIDLLCHLSITCIRNAYYVGVPQPIVTLVRASVHSLSISWSATSPHDSNYIVYWSGPSTEMDYYSTVTKYTISGLVSNTPYNITVEAVGIFGRINSTSQTLFTNPKG